MPMGDCEIPCWNGICKLESKNLIILSFFKKWQPDDLRSFAGSALLHISVAIVCVRMAYEANEFGLYNGALERFHSL